LTREITTDVSYAPFVVSAEEQTWYHAAHGWKTDEQVAEWVESDPIVDQIIMTELTRSLG